MADYLFKVISGGEARGTARAGADLDVIVVGGDGERFGLTDTGRTIEYRYIPLEAVGHENRWLERTRFVWTNEVIFLAGDKEAFEGVVSRCKMTPEERRDILYYCLRRLEVRGFRVPYINGIHTQNRPDYWKDDKFSEYHFRNSAFEYLITIVYAINNQFTPSPKWRYHILQKQPWLPKAITDYTGFNELTLEQITEECAQKIAADKLLPADVSNYRLTTALPMFREHAPV